MKRILIMGNSHCSAIKLGWDQISEQAGHRAEIHFFVAPSPIFARLGADGSVFGELPESNLTEEERALLIRLNGTTAVDLETFDEVLLVGMFWAGTNEIVPFLTSFAVDGLYETTSRQRLTVPAFRDMMRGVFSALSLDPIWTDLRRPRLTLLMRPMPVGLVQKIPDEQIQFKNFWTPARIEFDKVRPILEMHKQLAHGFYGDKGIELMHQPEETLLPSGLTRDKYCRDPLDWATEPGKKIDVGHVNAEFGRICMAAYLDRVVPTTPPN
jgi:hypothetical protein